MRRRIVAQKLIERLNEKLQSQLNLESTLILGVVLKGLPVSYSLAKMNDVVDNFVPIVAQRHMYMQHHVESYFPSLEWKNYFTRQLNRRENLLVVDDVVNTGFTKQRVESIVHALNFTRDKLLSHKFAALILNQKNLANPRFVNEKDIFALRVNAKEVECDWGLITIPLWDIPIETARRRCEEYLQKFWSQENRTITITY